MSDTTSHFGNREDWLNQLVDKLRPHFAACKYPLPDRLRVSVGFASVTPLKTLGQCWQAAAAADAVPQIFITPLTGDALEAAGTLMHELLHAALPSGSGHKKPFIEGMKAIGLEGKPKHAGPNAASLDMLRQMIQEIGEYPHVQLTPETGAKKQTTRMRRLTCPANEQHPDDYIIRASKKMIEIGIPTCPCGKEFYPEPLEEEDPS